MPVNPLMSTPNGASWAGSRACGIAVIAKWAAVKRPQFGVLGGSYGAHVSSGTTELRSEGLGGGTG